MSVETQLRERLTEAADRFEPPAGPHVVTIRERARRRNRRSTAARVAALTVVALGAITLVRGAIDNGGGRIAAEPDEQGYRRPSSHELHGALPPDEADPPTWRSIETGFGSLHLGSVRWSGEAFSVVGSDPETGEEKVFVSHDGEEWDLLPSREPDLWGTTLTNIDGVVFALSQDDTGTWRLHRLTEDRAGWEEIPTSILDPLGGDVARGEVRIDGNSAIGFGDAILLTATRWTDPVQEYLVANGILDPETAETIGLGVSVGDEVATITMYNGEEQQTIEVAVDEIAEFDDPGSTSLLELDPASGVVRLLAEVEGTAWGPGPVAVEGGAVLVATSSDNTYGQGADTVTSRLWRVEPGGIGDGTDESPRVERTLGDGELTPVTALGAAWTVERHWATSAWDLQLRGGNDNAGGGTTSSQSLPYLSTVTGGEDALVGVGFAVDPSPSLVQQGIDAFGSLFGGGGTSARTVVAVTTDGTKWSWQDAEEIVGTSSDWVSAAVGNGRIVVLGTNYREDGTWNRMAVASTD